MGFIKFSVILGVALLQASGNAQTPTPSPDFDCPDHNDSIHPDPNDCSKYFVCTNGLAWHEDCPPGLLFDPTTLECNWPWEVTCFGATPSPTTRPPTTSRPPTTTTTTPAPGTTEEPEPTTSGPPGPSTTGGPTPTTTAGPPPTTTRPPGEFICPSPDGTFPHPSDCNAYYVCESGQATLSHCPPGLHYDPILQVCNWPDEVNCEPGKAAGL